MSTKPLVRGADFGDLYVIGVDPGPVPGVVGLLVREGRLIAWDIVQCSANTLGRVLLGLRPSHGIRVLVATEQFVNGPRSGKLATPGGGRDAREIAAEVAEWAFGHHLRFVDRPAAGVKPWATDRRLGATQRRAVMTGAPIPGSLLDATKGVRHARDGARHALFAAVHTNAMIDPLSKHAGRSA